MVSRVIKLEPQDYELSPLHVPDRNWFESNCYTDLWIAILHSLGFDSRACLGMTLACGYSADQWTFFKPSLSDLHRLYGVVTEEMTVWRSILEHCEAHISARQLPLVEVDAYFLPDTVQTDYKRNHNKTTIAVNSLDIPGKKLEYFHNAGYFELRHEDFDGIFHEPERGREGYLPPYCETVKLEHIRHRSLEELKIMAREMARLHLQSRPCENPMVAFSDSIDKTLNQLVNREEDYFHAWVFASLRQLGAGFELGAIHLRWLAQSDESELLGAALHFENVANTTKMLVMKTARMAMSGNVKSLSEPLTDMKANLDTAYSLLDVHL